MMLQNLSSAAVVIGALRVNPLPALHDNIVVCSLVYLCTFVAYITNNMDPNQTAPLVDEFMPFASL